MKQKWNISSNNVIVGCEHGVFLYKAYYLASHSFRLLYIKIQQTKHKS